MNLVIVGSIAIDDVETPHGRREYSIGGSATFASLAASKFTQTGIVGVIGNDFPEEVYQYLKSKNIDLSGLEKVEGKTFRWKGVYNDINIANTIDTQLNVFEYFTPKLPLNYLNTECLFLGNIHPQLQLDVISQASNAKIIACDTMNFWIKGTPELLIDVIKKVNILFINEEEIKQLTNKKNIFAAAEEVLKLGPEYVVIKKGEHGAVLYSKYIKFFVPIYIVDNVIDPTGAGDSFAGAFLGYIAKIGKFDKASLKNAMLYGTVAASFNIESFSFDNLGQIELTDIDKRVNELKELISL